VAHHPTEATRRPQGAAARTLDARTLQLRFAASLGPLRVRGAFTALQGWMELPGDPEAADGAGGAIAVEVMAASIRTGLAMRDRHLLGASFLHASEHPRLSFRSLHLRHDGGDLVVTGVLTVRGVARELVARAKFAPVPQRPASGEETGAETLVAACAEFSVDIRAFGVAVPRGLDVLNPIFRLIGTQVLVAVRLELPAAGLPASWLSARER